MKNLFKGLSLCLVVFALVMGLGVLQASASSIYAVGAITETGALTITAGGTLAVVTGTNALNLGTDAAAKTITIGNNTTTSALALISGTGDVTIASADDIFINSSTDGNVINIGTTTGIGSIINIGTSDTASSIYIGTAASNLIAIGNGAFVTPVTIGSTNTTSTTTINSGTTTGRLVLAGSGQIDISGTAPAAPAATGAGTGTITANSTDAVGQIGVDSQVANTALVLTFNKTWAVAPLCVVSGADAGGAAAIGEAAGVIVTSTATTMTLTYTGVASAKTFNYHCFKTT